MLYFQPERKGKVFLVAGLRKHRNRLFLRWLCRPILAEHYQFGVHSGFLIVFLQPKYKSKRQLQVLVSSYFHPEDQKINADCLAKLRREKVKLIEKSFESASIFIQFAKLHPVLWSDPWVSADLDTPEMRALVADFY